MTVYEILNKIQSNLKVPKNHFNQFGKYSYRSCEDIVEAIKPLLSGSVLTISDDLVFMGTRYYVKATATITHDGQSISCSAYAREEESQKGMSAGQLTGSTSSYARKYALNGLFAIDDTKDADTTNTHDKPEGFIDKEQIVVLIEMIEESGADLDKFMEYMKVETIDTIPKSDYKKAVAALNAKKKAK